MLLVTDMNAIMFFNNIEDAQPWIEERVNRNPKATVYICEVTHTYHVPPREPELMSGYHGPQRDNWGRVLKGEVNDYNL